ncbi:MAG: DUF1294 domain-containing protein [Lachnospiraceae bacterium]|nr:DUF1294 domain-containing protein [Lachnospiraceae bacterium]
MDIISILIVYVIIINIAGFCAMGLDKHRAKKNAWRIPEKRLFLFALAGGSIGSILGMYVFRHKTKHWYFVWGMPAILIIQIVAAFYLLLC